MGLPRVAYVNLWFPKASETFIFREVEHLVRLGLPLSVYTLYGRLNESISDEMSRWLNRVERIGLASFPEIVRALGTWRKRDPETVSRLFHSVPLRRWSSLEVAGENLWAFFSAFYLALLLERDGVQHIHAPFANGPATAAWVASTLTGIPFSFTGRAHDIYPPDGALSGKIRDCAFFRTNTRANVAHLESFSGEFKDKLHLTYNALTFRNSTGDGDPAPAFRKCADSRSLRLLAVGRFCAQKGFEYLLDAMRILLDRSVDVRLTLVGSGYRYMLYRIRQWMRRLGDRVEYPGWLPHDAMTGLFCSHHLLVMPSVIAPGGARDGIPNVVIEALSIGLPVVATNVSGIPEVVRPEETGRLVPPADATALADAVCSASRNIDATLDMARAGRRLVSRMFDAHANNTRLIDLYSSHL